MKKGDKVLFVVKHKIREGILLRQDSVKVTIKSDKIYRVRKSQVATEDWGGKNARERFSLCGNNAGHSRRDGEENWGIWTQDKGKTKSPQIFKGKWAI